MQRILLPGGIAHPGSRAQGELMLTVENRQLYAAHTRVYGKTELTCVRPFQCSNPAWNGREYEPRGRTHNNEGASGDVDENKGIGYQVGVSTG